MPWPLPHFFFYCKRFNTSRLPIVKFNNHFCFSRVKTLCYFFINALTFFFFFFYFFSFFVRINSIQFSLHLSFIVFFFLDSHVGSFLLRTNIFASKTCVISSLNNSGEKKFWQLSCSKVVVIFSS